MTIAGLALLVGGDLVGLAWLHSAPGRAGIGAALVGGWNTLIAGLLIWIGWKTGERPRWRWGKHG